MRKYEDWAHSIMDSIGGFGLSDLGSSPSALSMAA